MANYQQAPQLKFSGEKPSPGKGEVEYHIPADIYAFITSELVKSKATA